MHTAALTTIFILALTSFLIAFLWAPSLIRFLKAAKMGKSIRLASETPVFAGLHQKKQGTPTMGGILIWVTVVVLAFACALIPGLSGFDFLSRQQSWLPLGALVASGIVGLVDDYLNVRGIGAHGGGLRARHRLLIYTLISLAGAWWFYVKLDWDVIRIPFVATFQMGGWYVLAFVVIIAATSFSTNEADGLDGLAGGLLLAAYAAYGAIAFAEGKFSLAGFCAVIVGALIAFLWFNIHPARFFMGDTGAMSLGVTLGVVAMLTNYSLLLPIICFPFVLESMSVILQIASKKLRHGKKIFKSAPLHHHLEASGWLEPQIVMRFWMIAAITAIIGFILALVDMQLFR